MSDDWLGPVKTLFKLIKPKGFMQSVKVVVLGIIILMVWSVFIPAPVELRFFASLMYATMFVIILFAFKKLDARASRHGDSQFVRGKIV